MEVSGGHVAPLDLPPLQSWRGDAISPFTRRMSTARPWRASRRRRRSRVPTQRPTLLNRDTDSSAYSPLSPDVRTYFWPASDTLILDFTAFLLTPGGLCSQVSPWPAGMERRRRFRCFCFKYKVTGQQLEVNTDTRSVRNMKTIIYKNISQTAAITEQNNDVIGVLLCCFCCLLIISAILEAISSLMFWLNCCTLIYFNILQ